MRPGDGSRAVGGKRLTTPREIEEALEHDYLKKYAAKSDDELLSSRVYAHTPDTFRTAYQRDYTRIIHSRAFRRLRHKTQVFLSPKNDHICTRLEHSLYVASIARTISKALGLNNELVAAIAAGHDVGHPPFGHEGETCLAEIARDYDMEFHHELHSLRVIDLLDSPYLEKHGHAGLNLTFAVRDGIACHNGEKFEQELVPDRSKKPQDLEKVAYGDPPATLEGCVVRFADKVAYVGRDVEDAIIANVIRRSDIPKEVTGVLGDENRHMIARLVNDIVENHRSAKNKDAISLSESVHSALTALYDFSIAHIYKDEAVVRRHFGQVKKSIRVLFLEIADLVRGAQGVGSVSQLEERKGNCLTALCNFLEQDITKWRELPPERLALDFVAGMTDSFFIHSFEELFLPRSTV